MKKHHAVYYKPIHQPSHQHRHALHVKGLENHAVISSLYILTVALSLMRAVYRALVLSVAGLQKDEYFANSVLTSSIKATNKLHTSAQ